MSTPKQIFALAAAAALGLPTAAGAQDFSFTYLEGGALTGFVNDVETSGRFTGDDGPFEFETDADSGGFIGGAWEFTENLHVFGEYSSIGQELEVRDGTITLDGDFEVVRWRVGVGYAYPFSSAMAVYGRLSFDNVELKDARVAGVDLDIDADESGIGGEVGMIWAATPTIHLQGHLRYTPAGGITAEGADAFESDILVGVNGRWYFRPNIALVAGYEYGKITNVNVGVRFSF